MNRSHAAFSVPDGLLFFDMRVDAGVHGVLGIACLVGLSLYVLGFIDWGREASPCSPCAGSSGS
jgi:hypothetical protein